VVWEVVRGKRWVVVVVVVVVVVRGVGGGSLGDWSGL